MTDDVKPWDLAEAQAEFTPARRTVPVVFDGTVATEIDRIEAALPDSDDGEVLAARLAELHEQVKAKARPFVIEAIGDRWRDIIDQHPPTQEQQDLGFGFNPDTLPISAVQACCVLPEMTVEQTSWLHEHLAAGQWRRLWQAALDLNVAGEDGLGKSLSVTARRLLSAKNLTTASPGESLGASSPADE